MPHVEYNGARARRAARSYRIAEVSLAALLCLEIAVNAGYGIGEAGIFPKQNYLSKTGSVKPAVEMVKQSEKTGDNGFERMEFTAHTTYNTPVIYGYKGISYYSSTSYVAVNEMFGKLGLIDSNAWYVYRSAPPAFNSMFAIRYLLSQDGAFYNGIYPEAGRYSTDTVSVYENPYFLPLGFMVSEETASWNLQQNNPFLCQEDFYRRAAGLKQPLFYKLDATAVRLENMTVNYSGGADGVHRFTPSGDGKAMKAVYKVTARQDGPVYFYVKSPKIETVKVTNRTFEAAGRAGEITTGEHGLHSVGVDIAGEHGLHAVGVDVAGGNALVNGAIFNGSILPLGVEAPANDIQQAAVGQASSADFTGGAELPGGAKLPAAVTEHNIRYPYIIDAQFAYAGDDIEIELIIDGRDADSFTLFAYDFDERVFSGVWEQLSRQVLTVTHYTDTTLNGYIDVHRPGLMYTSIPYSEGWSVAVNGSPVPVETIGNGALIAIRLPAGKHTISFRYMTPGLIPGAVITICAALLLVGVTMYRRLWRKGATPGAARHPLLRKGAWPAARDGNPRRCAPPPS